MGREFANTAPHIGGDVATLRRGRDSRHRLLPRAPKCGDTVGTEFTYGPARSFIRKERVNSIGHYDVADVAYRGIASRLLT